MATDGPGKLAPSRWGLGPMLRKKHRTWTLGSFLRTNRAQRMNDSGRLMFVRCDQMLSAAAAAMAKSPSASNDAPPTNAPSTSGSAMSSAALFGFTEPPY